MPARASSAFGAVRLVQLRSLRLVQLRYWSRWFSISEPDCREKACRCCSDWAFPIRSARMMADQVWSVATPRLFRFSAGQFGKPVAGQVSDVLAGKTHCSGNLGQPLRGPNAINLAYNRVGSWSGQILDQVNPPRAVRSPQSVLRSTSGNASYKVGNALLLVCFWQARARPSPEWREAVSAWAQLIPVLRCQ